jgi:hypothetical protein
VQDFESEALLIAIQNDYNSNDYAFWSNPIAVSRFKTGFKKEFASIVQKID